MVDVDKLDKKYFLSDRPVIVDENTGVIRLILYEIFRPADFEGRTIYTKSNQKTGKSRFFLADSISRDFEQELNEAVK